MERTLYFGVFADGALVTHHGALAIFQDKADAETLIENYKKVKRQTTVVFTIDLVKVLPFRKK